MTLATTLRKASRDLIDTFGNTATIYTYSSATTSSDNEGSVSVSDWKTGSSVKVVDGENAKATLSQLPQGIETLGEDQKVVRDDTTVSVNDRLNIDSIDYKITEIQAIRVQDTLVIQILTVVRATGTTYW